MKNSNTGRNKESLFVVVEDNSNDALFLLKAFEKVNNEDEFILLKNGEDAFKFLIEDIDASKAENIKVIFLDISLPKINGFELLRKLKKNDITKNIPVVILTSSGHSNDINMGIALGANSYVIKPIKFNKYNEKVQKICDYWCNLNIYSPK